MVLQRVVGMSGGASSLALFPILKANFNLTTCQNIYSKIAAGTFPIHCFSLFDVCIIYRLALITLGLLLLSGIYDSLNSSNDEPDLAITWTLRIFGVFSGAVVLLWSFYGVRALSSPWNVSHSRLSGVLTLFGSTLYGCKHRLRLLVPSLESSSFQLAI